MSRFIYADNAATTAVSDTAFNAMVPFLREQYGNPSSLYRFGGAAKKALTEAREKIAKALGAEPGEIFFTACGSESDNWALKGIVERKGPGHIISTAMEHHAILHTLQYLEKHGCTVTYLMPDQYGMITAEQVKEAIRPDTILITIMMANNEIGTILPIKEIGEVAKAHKIVFHTDAVQVAGHIPIDVNDLNVSMLSISGHKFHGPKGVGALYVRKGTGLPPFIHGGGQERNLRAGTENVAGIAGMAAALEEALANLDENAERITALRDRLIAGVLKIKKCRLTGHPTVRLPGNASFVFESVEGESIMLRLDAAGICSSTGSACSSASLEPSHVLLSTGLPVELAHGSVRLSLGEDTTEDDVDYMIENITKTISDLRAMSPIWEG